VPAEGPGGGGAELRVAIAGVGFIGAVHARSARLAGGRLAGVAASSPEHAARAASELGAERAFASAEELVEADGVDVVHVCTPNYLHLPLAEAALAAGKHVICEKPLALDAEGALRLTKAATDAGRQAAVPFVYRYYPTVREARERVRAGTTGPLRLLHGTYLQDWLASPEDDNWRVEGRLGGASRAFADIGSHWCDLAEFVSGHRIARLCARTLVAVPERLRGTPHAAFERGDGGDELRPVDTEDAAVVQFETDRGALGSVVISQLSPGRKNRLWLELDGADEALAFDQEQPETLWCGRREATTILRRDPATLSPRAARLSTLPAGHPQGYADCFDGFVRDVYDAIRTGAPADGLPLFSDGLRAARLTEAVLASAAAAEWVDVAATEPVEVTR
jgi:predicted dehydrogenase